MGTFDLKIILLLCSATSLLNIISIQAYVFKEYESQVENEINTLEIYTNKNHWAMPVKEDNRPIAQLAAQLDFIHKKLTSTIFADKPGENIIYSPISVSTTLMILAIGARGRTAQEILLKGRLSVDRNAFLGFLHLIKIFEREEGVELKFANQIFASDFIKIHPRFQMYNAGVFHSKIGTVDFRNPDNVTAIINRWSRQQTNNLIDNVVSSDDFKNTFDNHMAIVNAIYFKGAWEIPFNPNDTEISPFYVTNSKSVDVPMMFINEEFNWGRIRELNARFIEIPYKEKKGTEDTFSMYLLVPIENDGLNLIEKNLNLIDFRRLNNQKSAVDLYLPKFKIESKLNIASILKKMGIQQMFSGHADFSGITNSTDLIVSKITQKAFLGVNEEGSTAAAVTTSEFAVRMMPSAVKANRPFLCAIVLKSVGLPLFYARIADPTEFQ